jgi:stage II sporulation protein D
LATVVSFIRAARARLLIAVALVMAVLAAPAGAAVGVFEVQSGGYGHGVGMSQYGADGYAQHGAGYRFILAHYYRHTSIGRTDPGQTVRVLLSSSGEPTFSGASQAGGTSLRAGVSYTVAPNADGTLTLSYHGYDHKTHKPAVKKLGPFAAPLTVSGTGALRLAGKGAYDGSLAFRPAGAGSVQTVEAVGLDDYVSGVVPSEVPSSWPIAALKAQAVAARTYAITSDVNGGDYNLYDDTRSQAYGGVDAETARTNEAVGATSGQIVTYRAAPAITYFFSSSGGHTESIQNVWPGASREPWLVGVPDPFDAAGGQDRYHHVVHVLGLADAAARLHGLFGGSFEGVRVLRHGVSPRVLRAQVIGSRASSTTTGTDLERRLGLLTDWEVFETVTATAGDAPAGDGGTAKAEEARAARAAGQTAGAAQTQGMAALVPLVDTLLVQAIPGLHGTVVPARAGAPLVVELRDHGRWHVVVRASIDGDGRYDVALPGHGTYRVRYRGLTTAPVTVS